jgi:putative flippase GtrA
VTFVRYVAVQLAAYAIDMGVFFALFAPALAKPAVANLFGKLAAGLFAFFAHRHFTFQVRIPGGRAVAAVKYFALLALNAPLSSLILMGILTFVSNVVLAKVLSDVVSVGLTFALTRWLVFPPPRADRNKHAKDPMAVRDK